MSLAKVLDSKLLKKPVSWSFILGSSALVTYGVLTGSSLLTGYGLIGVSAVAGVALGYSVYKTAKDWDKKKIDVRQNYSLWGLLGKSSVAVGAGLMSYSLIATGYPSVFITGLIGLGMGVSIASHENRHLYNGIKSVGGFLKGFYKTCVSFLSKYSSRKV